MTREQYLELKTYLKEKGSILRSMKRLLREDMSREAKGEPRVGDVIWGQQHSVSKWRNDVRVKHIFMSLVRGRTRVQIENNFESQKPDSGLYSWVEQKLKDLCEQYGLECDVDENYKVISVSEVKVAEGVA